MTQPGHAEMEMAGGAGAPWHGAVCHLETVWRCHSQPCLSTPLTDQVIIKPSPPGAVCLALVTGPGSRPSPTCCLGRHPEGKVLAEMMMPVTGRQVIFLQHLLCATEFLSALHGSADCLSQLCKLGLVAPFCRCANRGSEGPSSWFQLAHRSHSWQMGRGPIRVPQVLNI